MNYVCLLGNLTRDPEMRYTPAGQAVAAFGIAINRKWKDAQTGEPREEVTFVDVTAFGRPAENVAQYFKKGSKILVTGRLRLDQWEDRQSGQKRQKLVLVMESFEFVGGREQPSEGQPPTERPASPPPMPATAPKTPLPPPDDDNLPF